MAHGTATNSIELSGDAKSFDRVARKWNVDYAFYKTGSDKYLLFFKAGQADAMTACFSEYSRKVLSKAKSNRVPIREQLKQAADAVLFLYHAYAGERWGRCIRSQHLSLRGS